MIEKILVQKSNDIELLSVTFSTPSSCGKETYRRDTRAVCPRKILRTPQDSWRETRVNTTAKQWAVMKSSFCIALGQLVA